MQDQTNNLTPAEETFQKTVSAEMIVQPPQSEKEKERERIQRTREQWKKKRFIRALMQRTVAKEHKIPVTRNPKIIAHVNMMFDRIDGARAAREAAVNG